MKFILFYLIFTVYTQVPNLCANASLNKCLPSTCYMMKVGPNYRLQCCPRGYIAGNHTCHRCPLEPSYIVDKTKEDLMPFLHSYTENWNKLTFSQCFGACTQGQRISTLSSELENCKTNSSVLVTNCSYACSDIDYLNSATSALNGLYHEFQRGNFLNETMKIIFNSVANMSLYDNRLSIYHNTTNELLQNFIEDLVHWITPNIPNVVVNSTSGLINIYSHDNITEIQIQTANTFAVTISSIVGGVIGIVAVLGLIYGYYRYNLTNLDVLPKHVAWSFRQYEQSSVFGMGWTYCGQGLGINNTNGSALYYKKMEGNDHDYVVKTIFSNIPDVDSITAIYNPTLLTSFINRYMIQRDRIRDNSKMFQKCTWQNSLEKESHAWVYDRYSKLLNERHQGGEIPIIGLWHGTDSLICEKIASTGFTVIGTLDAGWYGRGVYFSSTVRYCIPYMATKKNPALMFSWALPGNTYPVIESHDGKDKTLFGAAIKNGYDSHYVVTNEKGYRVVGETNEPLFDEIVIAQEAQIVPAFIVTLSSDIIEKARRDAYKKIG